MREEDNPFETSIDSGICLETQPPEDNVRKTYQYILFTLERDKKYRDEQRKRLSQISEKKFRKKHNNEPCNVCCENLELEDIKNCIKCCNCQKSACRGKNCSVWLPSQSGWECQLCHQSNESRSKSSEWLQQHVTGQFLSPTPCRSERSYCTRDQHSDFDIRSETASSYGGYQKEKVRDFVEEILAEMLGGPLDNVTVTQLNKSRQYLPSWDEGDGPGLSHVKLKRLIERIIQETLRLPAVTDDNHITGRNTEESLPFFDPKKYQDLLATAVLNKIIDSYNYEKKFESSTETASAGGANLDTNHNALIGRKEQSASISSSSIEPQSDSSVTDAPANFARSNNLSAINSGPNRFIDLLNSNDAEDPGNLSDYIAQHKVPLPDFSIESDSSNEDIPETNGINKAWEGNWLFKKKKPGSEPSASVGMLVPSPKEDVRTLIGDKTADELSDLSEAGSDYEADCEILYEDPDYDPQNVRIQNKCVIGGKSPVGIFDELLDATSMVSISSIGEGEPIIAETKNNFVLGDDPSRDVGTKDFDMEAINAMVTTNLLKGSPVKSVKKDVKIDDELIAPPNCFIDENKNLKQSTLYITTKNIPEAELTSNGSMSPGSIAEREHKKWYNAVDMPNNPYSPEALKRRLSNASDKPFDIPNINSPLERATSEDGLGNTTTLLDGDVLPDYKRYGRDYYINDAKHACGISKKNLASSESQLYPTMQQQQQPDDDERDNDNEISESTFHRSRSWGDKRSGAANDIFTARPVRVEESDPILNKATKLEYLSTPDRDFYLLPSEEVSSLRSISASEHSLSQAGDSLTPSEDSDTIRVYDLKTQQTKLIKDDQVRKPLTDIIKTPTRPNILSLTQKSPTSNSRAVTPTSLKFLQPKRKLFDPRRIMSEDAGTQSPIFERENSVHSNGTMERPVIEEDVVSALPSVKKLAQAFLRNSSQDSSSTVTRPKSSSWKSVDVKSETTPVENGQSVDVKTENTPVTNGESSTPKEEKCNNVESSTSEATIQNPIAEECTIKEDSAAEKSNEENNSTKPVTEECPLDAQCSRETYSPPYKQSYHPAESATTPTEEAVAVKELSESVSIAPAEVTQPEPVKEEPIVQEAVEPPQPLIPEPTPEAEEPAKSEPVTPISVPEPTPVAAEEPTPEAGETTKTEPITPISILEPTPIAAEEAKPESTPETEEQTRIEPKTPASTPEPTTQEDEQSYPTETLAVQPEPQIIAEQSAPVEPEQAPASPAALEPEQEVKETQSEPASENQAAVPTSLLIPTNEEQKPIQNGSSNTAISPEKEEVKTIITSPPEPLTADEEIPKPDIVKQQKQELRAKHTEAPMRERPISPVLVPGKLKSNIAFFENLKNK